MTIVETRSCVSEEKKLICEMVLAGIEDVRAGRVQDFDEFFDELEKRYQNE